MTSGYHVHPGDPSAWVNDLDTTFTLGTPVRGSTGATSVWGETAMGDLTAACPLLLCHVEKMVPGPLLRWAAGGTDDRQTETGKVPTRDRENPSTVLITNHQHRLPREGVQLLSLEAFKTWQDKVLNLISWLTLP